MISSPPPSGPPAGAATGAAAGAPAVSAAVPRMSVARLNRIAWLMIWSAFAIFCLLCAGTGYAAAWVRTTATVADEAELKPFSGTVLTQPRGLGIWNNSQPGLQLREGDQVRTAGDARALIRLPDGSSLDLFPDTQVRFETLQRGLFLPEIRTTAVRVVSGVARVTTTPARTARSRFQILLPQGQARLDPGMYVARVHDGTAELTVEQEGQAWLVGLAGDDVLVTSDQRAIIEPSAGPRLLPARHNLLANSEFTDPLEGSWITGTERKFRGDEDVLGSIERVVVDGRPAIHFRRTGSKGSWAESYARQNLEQNLAGFRSVRFRCEVKLVYQNVPGGGYLGSEYPFLVRLKFRNPRGEQIWVRGFYYQNESGNPTNNGEQIERGQWVAYESPNLLNEIIQPAELVAIELTASGHDYASYVRAVELVAE